VFLAILVCDIIACCPSHGSAVCLLSIEVWVKFNGLSSVPVWNRENRESSPRQRGGCEKPFTRWYLSIPTYFAWISALLWWLRLRRPPPYPERSLAETRASSKQKYHNTKLCLKQIVLFWHKMFSSARSTLNDANTNPGVKWVICC